ncbi:hypothetical protein [Mangrovimonas xylaniphaga]|uniref:hypothetical protein n=1 Tax=Mangrovimonas xylaniphaga TaxID=1645915 RepID=UPI0006B4513B|nr:hypothetical protein [Mangrovimonas xylaniphaga]
MTKYLIKKYTQNDSGGFNNIETKKVQKKHLKEHVENNWVLIEKQIPIVTPFLKWWNKFTTNQKIAIIAIIVPCFAVLGWILDKYFDNKYQTLNDKYISLNADYNSLKSDYVQLKHSLILTSDSLKTERQKFQATIQQPQTKTSSDKNQADKK